MAKSPVATKRITSQGSRFRREEIAAAELALKAHASISDPEILAGIKAGDRTMQEIAEAVDLTEAPEDAVTSLVIDLKQYCEREKIDWTQDVMSRVEHFRSQHAGEVQKQ